jgi:hypothetical protein|tara:strand:+ start:384 stop:644 length:261 start_codon:yes stop_codon:yes gene_type:complete
MGVRLKQNISVLNVQQWMLKKNLAKKKNNYKGLLLTVIVILTVSLLVGFVKYTQSNRVAMHDEVLIQQYSFTFIQALGIKKKDYHG